MTLPPVRLEMEPTHPYLQRWITFSPSHDLPVKRQLLPRILCCAAIVAACLVAPSGGEAQSVVQGRVLDDETGRPVVGAALELLTAAGTPIATTMADGEGEFRFRGLGPGRYSLRVGRLGYQEARIELQTNDTLEIALRLSVAAVALEPLEVRTAMDASSASAAMEGFERRRSGALGGTFLTRDQIARHAGGSVIDLIRLVPGIKVSGRIGYGAYIVSNRTGCPPAVYMDAAPVFRPDGRSALGGTGRPRDGIITESGALDALSLVHPLELEGIEIYTGPSQVPAVFGGSTAQCGVIALWTRRGDG